MKVEYVNVYIYQLCVLNFFVPQETPQFDALMAYLQRAQLEIRQIRCSEHLSRNVTRSLLLLRANSGRSLDRLPVHR